jgi:tyrosyl-tRNA synthetase
MRGAVANGSNPRDYKMELAAELTGRFHGAAAAQAAITHWNEVVQGGGVPQDVPLVDVAVPAGGIRIGALLKAAGLAPSTSEAMRKLGERAVRVDGAVVEDRELTLRAGGEHLLQLGKRGYARVRLTAS